MKIAKTTRGANAPCCRTLAAMAAFALSAAIVPTPSFAAALDLAGVDRTVTDVADLASYDEGVTNSSATLATLATAFSGPCSLSAKSKLRVQGF